MANLKISAATARAAIATTDMIPLAVAGSSTAYNVTVQKLYDGFSAGIGQINGPLTVGVAGATEAKIDLASLGTLGWTIVSDRTMWEGHPDEMMFFGYNVSGVGNFPDPTEHTWYMGMESDYYTSATDHLAEWYVQYTVGNVYNRRPLYMTVDLESHALAYNLRGYARFYTSDGDLVIYMDDKAVDGTISITGQTLIFQSNNKPIIKAARDGGGAAVEVLKLDASDRIVMGSTILGLVDVEINNNSYGFVLPDKANGKRYRISVRNGTLETAEVV